MNSSDKSLSQILAQWRLTPRRNPQFRAEVWARLEARRHDVSWFAYARSRVPLVAGVLTLALVAGALTGRERVNVRLAADRAALADAYVQSHDARTMRIP